MYDGRLGRRWNIDPKPIHSISRYATFANNPIAYTDIAGDTIYYFNSEGIYVKTEPNEHINGQHGITILNPEKVFEVSPGIQKTFAFHDQKGDGKRMQKMIGIYGKTKPLVFIKSQEDIEAMTEDAVPAAKDIATDKHIIAKNKSVGGKMDGWAYYLMPDAKKAGLDKHNIENEETDLGPFYIMDDHLMKVYNIMDAGNFHWALCMKRLGFTKENAVYFATKYNPNDSHEDLAAHSDAFKFPEKVRNKVKRNDPYQSVKKKSKNNAPKSKDITNPKPPR